MGAIGRNDHFSIQIQRIVVFCSCIVDRNKYLFYTKEWLLSNSCALLQYFFEMWSGEEIGHN